MRSQLIGATGHRVEVIVANHIIGGSAVVGIGGTAVVSKRLGLPGRTLWRLPWGVFSDRLRVAPRWADAGLGRQDPDTVATDNTGD
jgi:hypothetical protein